jgi:hypothetical protein
MKQRTVSALAGLVVISLSLAPSFASEVDPWTEPAPDQVRVFHHICENPSLPSLLRKHRIENPDWHVDLQPGDSTLCLVSEYVFRDATIYLELFPASGTDEVYLLSPTGVPGSGLFPIPLARLKAVEDGLIVSTPGQPERIHPVQHASEVRIRVAVTDSMLTIADLRPPETLPAARHALPLRISTPGGAILAIPCRPDSLPGCGFAALNIDLAQAELARWRDTTSSIR